MPKTKTEPQAAPIYDAVRAELGPRPGHSEYTPVPAFNVKPLPKLPTVQSLLSEIDAAVTKKHGAYPPKSWDE